MFTARGSPLCSIIISACPLLSQHGIWQCCIHNCPFLTCCSYSACSPNATHLSAASSSAPAQTHPDQQHHQLALPLLLLLLGLAAVM
jgi:hypothetical protein